MRAIALLSLVPLAIATACSSFETAPAPDTDAGAAIVDAGAPTEASVATDAATLAPYPAAVLADHPAGYWRMDITAGIQVPDESGNGHPLSLISSGHALGAPGATTGSTAIVFDGVASSAEVALPALDFLGKTAFTVECWVELTGSIKGKAFPTIWSRNIKKGSGSEGVFLYFQTSSPNLEVERDNETTTFNNLPIALTPAKFSHLVVTFDGINLVLYVDGLAASPKASNVDLSDLASAFTIARDVYGNYFRARSTRIAVYDHALTSDRVQAHRAAASMH